MFFCFSTQVTFLHLSGLLLCCGDEGLRFSCFVSSKHLNEARHSPGLILFRPIPKLSLEFPGVVLGPFGFCKRLFLIFHFQVSER